jgi:hypothetical protein
VSEIASRPATAQVVSSAGKPHCGDACSAAPPSAGAIIPPSVYDITSTEVALTSATPWCRRPMSIIATV